ncbi:MAG TPA: tetratricopeptide repeat protein [Pyrinomonadaceae bacterium]|nr:tetratricopeptide repeat protein [Pyrinomonadaceae bacterium]
MSTPKTCPSCGAPTAHEARFCRRCGASLRGASSPIEGAEIVSPQAATIPLRDEGRTTDGLAEDPRRPSPDTARVDRNELDAILRASRRDASSERPHEVAVPSHQLSHETAATTSDVRPPHDTTELDKNTGSRQDYETKIDAAYRPGAGDGGRTGSGDGEEELTIISVPRAGAPFSEPSAPLQVQPIPVVGSQPLPQAEVVAAHAPTAHGRQGAAGQRRLWPVVIAGIVAALLLTVAGVMLFMRLRQQPAPAETANVAPAAAPDPKKLSEDKLTEAEGLLASGDLNAAVAALREAVRIDGANVRARRRLADVLLESGARREGIEELRALLKIDANDFTAWRALAFAQLGEGLYADASESFSRLLALTEEGAQDPHDLLAYADALRQAGRTDEARAVYQRLSSISVTEVAEAARQRVAEMAAAATAPSPEASPTPASELARGQQVEGQLPNADASPTPAPPVSSTPAPQRNNPTPTPAPQRPSTPEEHYARGVQLWSSNRQAALQEFRAAGNHPDANYYLGLSYVEGRDVRRLDRASLVAALRHFQIAQSGRFNGQAQQYVRQLGREFDRTRN